MIQEYKTIQIQMQEIYCKYKKAINYMQDKKQNKVIEAVPKHRVPYCKISFYSFKAQT